MNSTFLLGKICLAKGAGMSEPRLLEKRLVRRHKENSAGARGHRTGVNRWTRHEAEKRKDVSFPSVA